MTEPTDTHANREAFLEESRLYLRHRLRLAGHIGMVRPHR